MDLTKALRELYLQKERLDRVIASLEELESGPPEEQSKKRPGRKGMDAQARQEVSARMRRYWESRRGSGNSPTS